MDCTAIVLAGGLGRRMGMPKALLRFGGKSLLERIVDELRQLTSSIIVVGAAGQDLSAVDAVEGVSIAADREPQMGPLMGLNSGLATSHTEMNVVVGCDMPLVSVELLRHMSRLADDYDAVVPRLNGRTQPLHAVYSRSCLPIIEGLLGQGIRRLGALAATANTRFVEEAELHKLGENGQAFLSLNTARDLAQAEAMLRAGAPTEVTPL